MNNIHSAFIVAVVALVTILLRFLPFIIFNGKAKTPKFVEYLGKVLPYAIMGMLVVYCLKSISFVKAPYGIPELVSCALTSLVYLWKRNTLFGIVAGTLCYMLLIQFVF